MRMFPYIWYGDSVAHRRKEIFSILSQGKACESLYVVVLPITKGHMLDIYPWSALQKEYYKKSDRMIIGAAETEEEAVRLACSIVYLVENKYHLQDVSDYIEMVLAEERID